MNADDTAETELELAAAGLYGAVLSSWQELSKKHPNGVITEAIGLHAWDSLDHEQRIQAFPYALGAYVRRVLDEENMRVMDRAVRDTTKTYINAHDVVSLHDSLDGLHHRFGKGAEVIAEVDAEALHNVLGELELLQHRVAMLQNQDGAQ